MPGWQHGAMGEDASDIPHQPAGLCGAAEVLLGAMRTSLDLVERAEYDRAVAAARVQSGKSIVAAAWAESRAKSLSLHQSIAYALGARARA